MIKKVKGGKSKHYCDVCGKLLYDSVLKDTGLRFLNMSIPEQVTVKRYDKHVGVHRKISGVWYDELCVDCANELNIKMP